jgi:hypothetical protein
LVLLGHRGQSGQSDQQQKMQHQQGLSGLWGQLDQQQWKLGQLILSGRQPLLVQLSRLDQQQ